MPPQLTEPRVGEYEHQRAHDAERRAANDHDALGRTVEYRARAAVIAAAHGARGRGGPSRAPNVKWTITWFSRF